MFNGQPFTNPQMQARPHDFSRVPSVSVPRSKFDRSHQLKTAFDAGYLVPIYCDEALPGDSFSMSTTTFARLATPIAPFMDNLYCDIHYFAVPLRLLHANWEKLLGAQTDPDDSTDYLTPKLTSTAVTGYAVGSLHDYLGLPTGVPDLEHVSYWHRAYNLIFNEFYRDQNLQDSVVVETDDGPDTVGNYTLLKAGKRHDYFTSCLPWPQKGDAVLMPLGSRAPVLGIGAENQTWTVGPANVIYESNGATAAYANYKKIDPASVNTAFYVEEGGGNHGGTNDYPNIYADLSAAAAATINQFREAILTQQLLEIDARAGTRINEVLLAHFGVHAPDFRLQRPEFLGGGSTRVNVSPVPQTSSTDATTPQGNMSGAGVFSHSGVGFTKSFVEHSVIIGLARVRADLTYQEGLDRMFSRSTKYDFYWPSLAHLGEQEVLNKEIYAQGVPADEEVFGYQERWAEYRFKNSRVTGKLRSNASGSLDVWHLAQDFSALPTLGDTFIQENPPISRVIAVNTEPHFIADFAFDLKCARPMPVYSVPSLVSRL